MSHNRDSHPNAQELAAQVLGYPSPMWEPWQWMQAATLLARAVQGQFGPADAGAVALLRKWEAVSESFDTRSQKGAFALAHEVNNLGDVTRAFLKQQPEAGDDDGK